MFTSFYTSVSGLNSFSQQLSVISDNIANSNTTGYKGGSTSFAEVLSSSTMTSSSMVVGSGVSVQSIAEDWTQGAISNTGDATDYAITGAGLFVLSDADGLISYTRDGQFSYNADGTLVTASGYAVQGYPIDEDGNVATVYGDITFTDATIPATSTTSMSTTINLNSGTATGGTFSSTTNIYDSLGNAIPLTINFTKTAANTWSWAAAIPSASGSTTSTGSLTFNTDGSLAGTTDPTIALTLTTGATASQSITWDLYNAAGSTNGTMTQYAAGASSISNMSQDGAASGQIESISTDNSGVMTASYSNGVTRPLYQLALATFNNYNGLDKAGNNRFIETAESGVPIYGVAGSGQFGTMLSGSLETANVDMASEMADMLIAQRAYESCARTFTTQSEMLQTAVNMAK